MIQSLVAVPSVSSHEPELDTSNQGVVDHLAQWASELGGRCTIEPVPGLPGKVNLIATFGPIDTGEPAGLLLSGHTDVVPVDADRWTSDPFAATERDGRLYGRGTADMKSFLALATTAVSRLDRDRLRRPVVILGTADEETSMAGARALVDAGGPAATRAIIGEPTGMQPITAHKGIVMGQLELLGRSGHSSQPGLGANAIDGMQAVLAALQILRQEWATSLRDPTFDVPEPTMNFGALHGGDAPNRICPGCTLTFDVRVVPGMAAERVQRQIHECAVAALEGTGVRAEYHPMFVPIPPFANAGSELVQTLERATGQRAGSVMFGTEAPFLQQLGMDTVVMGPGRIDVAHMPDEHIALAELEPAIELLGSLITRYCASKLESMTS
ncbi:MAG: acetylornithine deacetylase [Myxococcota bacterium]|jgi:acetylornithine deacetylase